MKFLITTVWFMLLFMYMEGQVKIDSYMDLGVLKKSVSIDRDGEALVRYRYPDLSMYSNFYIKANYKWISLHTSLMSVFTHLGLDETKSFSPVDITYSIGAEVQVFKFLDIGVSHYCTHPIVNSRYSLGDFYRSAGDMAYVRIKFNKIK